MRPFFYLDFPFLYCNNITCLTVWVFFLTSNIVWLVEVPVLLRVQYCTKVLIERGQFGFMNCVDNVSWPKWRDSNADVWSVGHSSEKIQILRSDEGLTFETSALKSRFCCQFTYPTYIYKDPIQLWIL